MSASVAVLRHGFVARVEVVMNCGGHEHKVVVELQEDRLALEAIASLGQVCRVVIGDPPHELVATLSMNPRAHRCAADVETVTAWLADRGIEDRVLVA